MGQLTNRSKSNPLIAMAVGLAGDVFLGKMALSGSSKIAGLIVPLVAKRISAFFHSQRRPTIFQKLATLLKKSKSNGHVGK
jgi:hypothetical protein